MDFGLQEQDPSIAPVISMEKFVYELALQIPRLSTVSTCYDRVQMQVHVQRDCVYFPLRVFCRGAILGERSGYPANPT